MNKIDNILEDNIGFIEEIDHMGSDLTIVNSARVSYGKKKDELDEKDVQLINYLASNKHYSPFRHVFVQFRIKAPEIVARQFWKHVIGSSYEFKDTAWNEMCLSEETEITLISNDKTKISPVKFKISELFRKWNAKPEWFKKNKIRVLDEQSNKFTTSYISEVFDRGMQTTYKITLDNKKTLVCTLSHPLLTNSGWKNLGEIVTITPNCIAINSSITVCTNGKLVIGNGKYKDAEWLKECKEKGLKIKEMAELAGCKYVTVRKWLKKYGLQYEKDKNYFKKGTIPWNKGLNYTLGNRELTEEQKNKIRISRSGEKSNFWKGGITSERKNISRWTIEQGNKVRQKYNFQCQYCKKTGGKLVSHHIIPVWADISKSRDINNLVPLHENCHKTLHAQNKELEWANIFYNEIVVKTDLINLKPIASKRTLVPKFSKIISVEFVGTRHCFDISVEGENHNFVANGIIVHNSGRYAVYDNEFYIPQLYRKQHTINKQASIQESVDYPEKCQLLYTEAIHKCYNSYKELIANGLCKEQARGVLPVSFYTEWIWSASLQAIANFIILRDNDHAQWEIKVYAQAMKDLVSKISPIGLNALLENM